MRYRRSHQPGGSYFFTLVTHQRQSLFSIPENIDRLRTAFKREKEKHPFTIEAIVILPDHLHTLWSLPEGDDDYSIRWSRIKRHFSIGCVGTSARQSVSRHKKREKPVWQRRFWEHSIRDESDWQRHMDYIHYNPVKHGHARSAGEWPYSSFKRCVQREGGTNRIGETPSRKASRESNMNSAPRRLGKAAIAVCPTKHPKMADGGAVENRGMLGTLRFAQPTFLRFNDYEILDNPGKVSAKVAKTLAEKEFQQFRVEQDKAFESDFDRLVEKSAGMGKKEKKR